MRMINFLPIWPVVAVLIGLYLCNSSWLAIFLYHGGILLALHRSGSGWKTAFGKIQITPAVGLFLLGVAAAPVVVWLMPLLLQMPVPEIKETLVNRLTVSGITVPGEFWLFAIYLCLPHPPLEEMAWRELLVVPDRQPHWRDLQFAAYHLLVFHYFFPGSWLFFAAGFAALTSMAWIWRELRSRSGGLALPVALHAGGDLGIMFGLAWLMR
jgi:membrane protease YdiL (CAAX protease family)